VGDGKFPLWEDIVSHVSDKRFRRGGGCEGTKVRVESGREDGGVGGL